MNSKTARLTAILSRFKGRELDPHYLAFLDLFNRQQFFEAHEVLEPLWLKDRHGPDAAFFKGLIQLAGAFVHVQKGRSQPGASLFMLANSNFEKYPSRYHRLNLDKLRSIIGEWTVALQTGKPAPPSFPKLRLD